MLSFRLYQFVTSVFFFTPVMNRMHWGFRSDQSIKVQSLRRARRLIQLAVLTIRMFQSKQLRCFSHTLMEGVRRDPEKCTVNPTTCTWSLTVVNDYVSYVFALSTSNLQWKLWGRVVGGGSASIGNSNLYLKINRHRSCPFQKRLRGHTYCGIFFLSVLGI